VCNVKAERSRKWINVRDMQASGDVSKYRACVRTSSGVSAMPSAMPSALHRALGPFGVMLLTLSALSPVASVYITGSGVLHLAGTGAALGLIAGGVISILLALLYAELGAAFPGAGGIYPSIGGVLGPNLAFACMALTVVTGPCTMAFAALGFADYVRVLVPALKLLPTAAAGIALACAVAVLRVRTGAVITGVFLAVEVATLALLTGVSLLHPARPLGEVLAHPVFVDAGVLRPVPLVTLGLGIVAGVYGAAGANWALYFAEEMHDARRMGRVIAAVGAIAAVIICVPLVLMVLSAGDLRAVLGAQAPISAYLAATAGPAVSNVVTASVVAAIFNNMIALCMALGRFFYATGRDGLWPGPAGAWLAWLHPRLHAPVRATLLVTVLSMLALLFGEHGLLILVSGNVFETGLIALAVWQGRRTGRTGRWFAIWLHPLVPACGLAVTVATVVADWLDADAGRPSVVLLGVVFAAAWTWLRCRGRPGALPPRHRA
jgi:amino acid transporter